ncbi:hypothetical protein FB451DRAFT_1163945 [Mycena latifolia]|nr:hypothetical protein FB451DRAFT_1163945 [Mycena latifolia]
MHIPFAVFISLALPIPAAPVVRDIETQDLAVHHAEEITEAFAAPVPAALVGDASALEARTKTKTKVAAKPKAAPKAEPAPKKASAKVAAKPAVKPPVKAKVPAKPAGRFRNMLTSNWVATKAKPPVKSAAKPPTRAPVKSAAKPPVKSTAAKPPAKVPSKAATGKAPATSACKKPKKGTSAKETAAPKKVKKGPRRLLPRTVQHPSATNEISLFHGTTATHAASIVALGPLISITPKGDFNSEPGGALLKLMFLILHAYLNCYSILTVRTSSVHEFADETDEWLSFVGYNLGSNQGTDPFHLEALEIFRNEMISGYDSKITNDFFQYAVVNQHAADTQLVLETHHRRIFCANVPKTDSLPDAQYTGTQGGNPQFETILATLKQPLCTIGG